MHKSHCAGCAIIIIRYTNSRYLKCSCLSKSVMFHTRIKGVSERSELTPCNNYACKIASGMIIFIISLILFFIQGRSTTLASTLIGGADTSDAVTAGTLYRITSNLMDKRKVIILVSVL